MIVKQALSLPNMSKLLLGLSRLESRQSPLEKGELHALTTTAKPSSWQDGEGAVDRTPHLGAHMVPNTASQPPTLHPAVAKPLLTPSRATPTLPPPHPRHTQAHPGTPTWSGSSPSWYSLERQCTPRPKGTETGGPKLWKSRHHRTGPCTACRQKGVHMKALMGYVCGGRVKSGRQYF